ncbi:hypothetical protein D3C83_07330 [compost metagenome]
MPRPVRALQDVLKIGGLDHESLALGVDLLLVRNEQHVHARRLQARAVGVERSGVAVEILARAELQAVHEYAHHGAGRARLGDVDQLDVAVVQVAHGGHEHVVGLALQALPERGSRMNNVHRIRTGDSGYVPGAGGPIAPSNAGGPNP